MSTPGDRYEQWMVEYAREVELRVIPAATVAVLRDGAAGMEVLLVRRAADMPIMGGMWVFPGGRVDPGDHRDGPADTYGAARYAAARELAEETGLQADPAGLVRLSHWTPPPGYPFQLATWFFLAPAEVAEVGDSSRDEGSQGERHAPAPAAVQVDGTEIDDFTWLTPAMAIRRHNEAEGSWFLPPTYVTLHHLSRHATVSEALAAAGQAEPTLYQTRLAADARGEMVALWAGDAGYDTADIDVPGPRHRLWAGNDRPWRFERS